MSKINAFRISLIITIIFNLLGTYFKIAHYPNGTMLLSISMIASLVFIILGLTDAFRNDDYMPVEKLMWTIGFIFMSWIAGLLYYPKFKKRNKYKMPERIDK